MIMGGGGGGGGGGNGAVALKVDIEGPDTRDLRGFGECPGGKSWVTGPAPSVASREYLGGARRVLDILVRCWSVLVTDKTLGVSSVAVDTRLGAVSKTLGNRGRVEMAEGFLWRPEGLH